jgi:LytS/YehU family sensor histidine kinase
VQKENLQSQFEVLKQQVNPHFLFNSLNVLTSLIKVDPDLAESFTERLSVVYRNVLENKDKDLVSLGSEMDFIRAYVFLLDIRFTSKVFVNINFDEKDFDAFVVPLALQLLIENAIKHNTFSKKNPLNIDLYIDDDKYLNVVNNLQSRRTHMVSTGIGLVNISKRYSLLSDRQPVFEDTGDRFIARIPLILKESQK